MNTARARPTNTQGRRDNQSQNMPRGAMGQTAPVRRPAPGQRPASGRRKAPQQEMTLDQWVAEYEPTPDQRPSPAKRTAPGKRLAAKRSPAPEREMSLDEWVAEYETPARQRPKAKRRSAQDQAMAPDQWVDDYIPTAGQRPSPVRRRASEHDMTLDEWVADQPPAPRKRPARRAATTRPSPARDRSGRQSPAPRRRGGRWAGPLSAVMLVILCAMGVLGYNQWNQYQVFAAMRETVDRPTYYPGVIVEGMDMSGMTPEDAAAQWAQREAQHRGRYEQTLRYGDQAWTLSAEAAGYYSDAQSVLARAYALGRSGTLEQRYESIRQLAQSPRSFEITRGHDEGKLKAFAKEIAGQLTTQGGEATIKSFNMETKEAVFAEGKPGYKADSGEIYSELVSRISGESQGDIQVRVSETKPKLSAAQLSKSFGKVTGAVTNAGGSTANRVGNIKLALAAISGKRVDPGETLSFNQSTGERTKKKGYKEAGAIRNGRMVAEPGGGVCQVSTTLFNAVAKADLEIVTRLPHSRPSTYVDIGKDAQVNWPDQDFVFKNNSDMPVFIVAYYSKGKVYVDVYGKKLEDGLTITITSKTTSTWSSNTPTRITNKNLAPGETRTVEKARTGKKATTYRNYVKNDKVIRSEVLCESSYPASGGVIEVGPGKAKSSSKSNSSGNSSGKKPKG